MTRWLALLLCIPWLAWAGASRDFDGDELELDVAAATTLPMSLVCWVNTDALAQTAALWVGDLSEGSHYQSLGIGPTADFRIMAISRAASNDRALTAISPTVGTWHLASGVYVSTTLRKAQIDGDDEGTNADSGDPLGEDRTCIGRLCDSSRSAAWDGLLAYCGVWTGTGADLTDDEIDELAAGQWTSWIDTANMTGFWLLLEDGTGDSEPDRTGITGTLVSGGTTPSASTDGPPIFLPGPPN